MSKQANPHTLVPVLFITLTQRNGTSKEVLWERAEHFYKVLSNFTKSHLVCGRGYETGNTHEHAVAAVPEDEVERFWKKAAEFDPTKIASGNWITPEQAEALKDTEGGVGDKWVQEVRVFDKAREQAAFRYVLEKHTPVDSWNSRTHYCPKYYGRCRKGRCEHTHLG